MTVDGRTVSFPLLLDVPIWIGNTRITVTEGKHDNATCFSELGLTVYLKSRWLSRAAKRQRQRKAQRSARRTNRQANSPRRRADRA